MNLQQAELEKRSKELDAREAFIDQKAKILENAPVTLKVYDARVKAFEGRLEELSTDIQGRTIELEKLNSNINAFVAKTNKRKGVETAELSKLDQEIKNKQKDLTSLEVDKGFVIVEIEDRQKYLEELEDTIDTTTEQGNERLLDINEMVSNQERENTHLLAEYSTLKGDYDILVIDFGTRADEYDLELKDLEEQKHKINVEIETITTKLSQKSQEYTQVAEEVDTKLSQLKEKETALIAKQDAIRLDQNKLDTDKRRWSDTKALYKI